MAAADYQACEDRVLLHEGSRYTDGVHPYDPGGPTRWGITLADARMYWKPGATAEDVRDMPRSVAVDIYRKRYWATVHGDDLPAGVHDTVFDYGVNSGVGRAGKVLRRVLGEPTNDWHVTPAVLAALAKRDPQQVINAICDERLAFLQSLAIWPTYRTGWTIRVREVRAFSLALAAGHAPQQPQPIPSDGMAKGRVPAPTTPKQVNVAAGTGAAAAIASLGSWFGTHPAVLVGLVLAVVLAVVVVHGLIRRRHEALSEDPMPGAAVVPGRGEVIVHEFG